MKHCLKWQFFAIPYNHIQIFMWVFYIKQTYYKCDKMIFKNVASSDLCNGYIGMLEIKVHVMSSHYFCSKLPSPRMCGQVLFGNFKNTLVKLWQDKSDVMKSRTSSRFRMPFSNEMIKTMQQSILHGWMYSPAAYHCLIDCDGCSRRWWKSISSLK